MKKIKLECDFRAMLICRPCEKKNKCKVYCEKVRKSIDEYLKGDVING